MKTESRAVEIRVQDDPERRGPGRLVGTLMVYGEEAGDRREIFEAGSLEWPADGIIVNRQHQRGQPIMRVVPEVRGASVVVDSVVPDTSAGRDMVREIRGGLFKGLSVEFRSLREAYRDGVRHIQRAALSAAAVVDSPSYAGATVEARGKGKARRRLWL